MPGGEGLLYKDAKKKIQKLTIDIKHTVIRSRLDSTIGINRSNILVPMESVSLRLYTDAHPCHG